MGQKPVIIYKGLNLRITVLGEKKLLVQIGTAAKEAGVSRQSLQYYVMLGLMVPTETSLSGRRLFDKKAIDRIKLIKKLNESGYPLRAIRDLFLEGQDDSKGSVT